MKVFKQTATFQKWYQKLKDSKAKTAIVMRLQRLEIGNPGDVASVGEGVSEMRIHYGPGYRIYFQRRGNTIIVLLCGGDKSTQETDIRTAKRLAAEWSEDDG